MGRKIPSTSIRVGFILADAYLECVRYFPNPSDMLLGWEWGE